MNNKDKQQLVERLLTGKPTAAACNLSADPLPRLLVPPPYNQLLTITSPPLAEQLLL